MPHRIFDRVSEDPQVYQVAEQMEPAAVQEHMRHRRGQRRWPRSDGRQHRIREQFGRYKAECDGEAGAVVIAE